MAVPSLANTWRVTYQFLVGTPAQINDIVVHVTAPSLSDPQLVANEAGGAWMVASSFKVSMSTAAVGSNITVQPFDGSSAPTVCTVSGFTGTAMSAAVAPVPANVAYIVTKRTLLSGRSYRGRMYIPAVSTTYVDASGSQWTPSSITTMQTAANAWRTELENGPTITRLVVYSAKHNTKADVSSLVPRQYLGTQRRRTTLRSP